MDWEDLTEEEREDYVNQDYVYRNFIMADPDTFSCSFSLGSVCADTFIAEESLSNPIFSISDVLTDEQLEAVRYFYIDRLSKTEIANKIGISVPAVLYRIRRAKDRLKRICRKK